MDNVKKYFAFISYQRSDEEWAERLRRKLEHYRLPLKVRKNNANFPRNIRPIFRDTLELSGGVLAKEIETALEQSRFLIVVCSPHSAQSPWVNKEIQTFINQGSEEQIIPFIIEGTPNSGDIKTECFPPALQSLRNDKELLGININELGRDAAIVKVVARMFNLHFDTLWQRFKREQKRKRAIAIGGTIAFAISGILVGAFFMRQNKIIEQQRDLLENATIRLKEDSLSLANHITRIQNDSITLSLQKDSILKTNNLLNESNMSLAVANMNLKEANSNIKKKNYELKVSNYSLLAERATDLFNQGNAIEAMNITKRMCNDEDIHQIMYQPEIERLLRRAHRYEHNPIERFKRRFVLDNINSFSMASLSHNGNELFLMQDESFITYNTQTGKIIQEIPATYPPDGNIYHYHEQTHTVIYSLDNHIFFKNIFTGQDVIPPITANDEISDIIISPGMIRLAYETTKIEHSDLEEPVFQSEWHLVDLSNNLNDFIIPNCTDVYDFSPNGEQIFVGIDYDYYLYDVMSHDTIANIPYHHSIREAHFTSDGNNLLVLSESKQEDVVDVFNIPTNEFVYFGSPIKGRFIKVHENPRNNIFVSGGSGFIKFYETEFLSHYKTIMELQSQLHRNIGGALIDSFPEPDNLIHTIQFNNSGRTMLSASSHRICIWDIDSMDAFDRFKSALSHARFFASSGKSYLTKNNDNLIVLKDITTDKAIGIPLYKDDPFQYSPFNFESISRNSEVVVMTNYDDSTVLVFRPINKDLYTIKYESNRYSLSLSMDKAGKYLVLSDGLSISVHDIDNKKILNKKKVNNRVFRLDMNPNGDEIAVINSLDSITIYNSDNLRERFQFYTGIINRINYSPDGKLIAGIGRDRTLKVWDSKTGKLIKNFKDAKAVLNYCSFSSDSKYILAKDENYRLYIWNMQTNTLIDEFTTSLFSDWFFCQDVPSMMYYGDSYGYHLIDFPTLRTIIQEFK